jgi:ABC-type multidrug transport system fused ATPase/permease subunit
LAIYKSHALTGAYKLTIIDKFFPEKAQASDDNGLSRNTKSQSLFKFVFSMSGKHQIALCLLAMVTTLINLIPIELQRRIIDSAIDNGSISVLLNLAMIYVLVLLSYQITKLIFRVYQGWVAESTIRTLRDDLIKMQSRHKDKSSNSGEAVSIISTEVESVGTYLGEHISDASSNIMMLIGVGVYMFIVEPQIAMFALLFLIPQIVLVPFMQRLLNRLIKKRVEMIRSFGDTISELDEPLDESPSIIKSIYKNRMRFTVVKYTMKSLINFMNSLGPLTVLISGGYLAVQGETTAGVIVAFLSGFQRMSGPVRGLIGFYRLTAQTSVQYFMLQRWIEERR